MLLECRFDPSSCGGFLSPLIRCHDTRECAGHQLADRDGYADHFATRCRRNQGEDAELCWQSAVQRRIVAYDWDWLLQREDDPFERAVTLLGHQGRRTHRRHNDAGRKPSHGSY